jgi:hypothetical protein
MRQPSGAPELHLALGDVARGIAEMENGIAAGPSPERLRERALAGLTRWSTAGHATVVRSTR